MQTRRGWLIGTALAAVGVYALMWLGYAQNWMWLARFDAGALEPAHRFGTAHSGWVTAWDVFCMVLGPNAFRLAALVVIVVALVRRRNVRIAMFLVISVQLGALVTVIGKALADRPRPDTALVVANGTSFPSGHAVGVTIGVLALLTVALAAVGAVQRRWLIGLGIVVVVAIGFGRVALNVHHPSDVIAGWALGYAYFVACLLMVSPNSPTRGPVTRGSTTEEDETPAVSGSER